MSNKKKRDVPASLDDSTIYIDIFDYRRSGIVYNVFIGGRGLGKTYSGLEHYVDTHEEFIYMRRLKSELKEIVDAGDCENGNPFYAHNENRGWNIGMQMITDKRAGIYNRIREGDTDKCTGAPIGHGLAMASVAKMKGFQLMKVRNWMYDEFIKEPHVPRLKEEGDAFFSAYDSINRNREFKGIDPIFVDFCSNATDIYNELFKAIGIVADVERMVAREQRSKYFYDRKLGIHLLEPTEEFKAKREQTALMCLTKGTRYREMAMGNTFSYNDFSLIKYQDVKNYKPVCGFTTPMNREGYVYIKKGERIFYVTYARSRCEMYNFGTAQDIMKFQRRIGCILRDKYTSSQIFFESYELKAILLDIIL